MERKILLINNQEYLMSAEEAFDKFQDLIRKAANKWSNTYGYDDMFQIASIGFLKAYKNYDISKGYHFSTYLTITVKGELLRNNRDNNKHLDVFSLNVASNEDETQEYIDNLADNTDFEELAIKNVLLNQIYSLFGNLDPLPMNIAKDYYLNGLTQRDIAEKYNYSLNHVSRLMKSIIKQITDYVNGQSAIELCTHKPITYEQLLEETRKYGTSKDAVLIIANKYGLKPSTVQNKIYYYRMKKVG